MKKKAIIVVLTLTFAILIFKSLYSSFFDPPPKLYLLPVSLDSLSYEPSYISEYGPILPFGGELKNPDKNTVILSPAIEFYAKSDANVYSPSNGIIDRIEYQKEDDDYYLWIKPKSWSSWIIEIDHLKEPKVKKGQKVVAGQILGRVGNWYQKEGIGRTELMIVKRGRIQHYFCPYLFAEKQAKEKFAKYFNTVFQNWKNNPPSNFSKKPVLPGCLYKELKDKSFSDKQNLVIVQ